MRIPLMPAPAGRRSSPDSVCAPRNRALWSGLAALCLLCGLALPAGAQTPTLTVSPATSTDGSYTLTWSAPASSSISTKLHERVGSGSWSVVGTYRSTVTSKSYTGKAAGTYGYKTEQCGTFFGSTTCWDAAGPVSVTVSAPKARPPATPAKPMVTPGNTYLSVSWTAPANNGTPISDYDVRYKRTSASTWTSHAFSGTGTSTSVTGLTNGTKYEVQVKAHNKAGGSGWSASGSGTPAGTGSLSVAPNPSTDGDYTVSWGVSRCFRIPFGGGSVCRVLQERVGSGGSWTAVSGIGASATSKAFTGKAAGTYAYRLLIGTTVVGGPVSVTVAYPKPTASISWNPSSIAYGGDSTLSWSSTHADECFLNGTKRATSGNWLAKDRTADRTDNLYCTGPGGTSTTVEATLTVEPPPANLPDAPAKPTLTGGALQFTADWTAPADNGEAITRYRLRYRRGAGNWTDHETTDTTTRATVTVTASGTYTVHVQAKNDAGWSKFSPGATVVVKPKATTPPAKPATPTGPASSVGTHTVSWTAVTGATHYQLQARKDEGDWTAHAQQTALSKDFTGLAEGEWDYQVKACNLGGSQCGPWSGTLTITVDEPPPPTLKIKPNPSPDGNYTVSWPAPAYSLLQLRLWQQVERSGTKAAWTIVGTYPGATTSKAFAQGSTPATYHYKAERCITVFGLLSCWDEGSPVSVAVGATPPATVTPATPTGLAGTTPTAVGDYTVSWTAVSGAAYYELQERDDTDDVWDTDYKVSAGHSQDFSDKDPKTWTYQVRACNTAPTPCSDWSGTMDVIVPKVEAPTSLTSTTPTATGNYTVSWDAVTHATRYQLQESDDDGQTWDTTYPIPTSTSQAVTGKTKGTWTYRARACRVRTTTCGAWSSTITVPVNAPIPPGNVTATTPDARGHYTLSWDAVTGADHYKVQESEDDGSTWPNEYQVNAGVQRAFTDKAPGARHYQVKTCADATTCSGWSSPALIVTVPRLEPPENLTHTDPDANGDYTVSWDAVTHATRYELKERDDGGTTWDTTYPIPSGTAKALTGKSPGIRDYQTRACRPATGTCSAWSGTLTVTVPGPPEQPDAPTLTPGDGQLTVTWTAPAENGSPLTGYNLRYQADTDTVWTSHTHTGTDTAATITGLTNGTAYTVQVRAVNARGNSPWSDGATASPAAFLAAPTGLSAPMVSDGNHTVRWQPSPGATCYKLAASSDGGQTWTTTQTGEDTYYKTFSAVPHGTWTYRVRACAGKQDGNWSSTITVIVGTGSIPMPPNPDTTTTVISQSEQTGSDEVGTLPGSFRVTEQGSASYRIELSLPPGSAGVTPPLALAYDSQRGNGLLGVGWAIEGLSAITRCRQTLSRDGAAQALTFTATDRFCLDGQRLVLSDGAVNKNRKYGDPNTEYNTETDSFATVTLKGNVNKPPDYFEVQRKDGSTATYGASGAASSEHKLYKDSTDTTGAVLTWALSEVKDSVGNKVTYHYTLDTDGHRLTHVRYAYGASKTAHRAEVVLAYESRNDPSAGYLAGRPVKSTKRLQRVTLRSAPSQGGIKTLYNYRLRYRDVSAGTIDTLSRLISVQGCVGAGESTCQPKTEFAWSDPEAGFNDKADVTTTLEDNDWGIVDTTPADINGDGLTDLVWTEAKGDEHRIRYALTNPATGQLVNQDFITTADEKDVLVYDVKYGCQVCDEPLKVHVNPVDINADGRQDLLVYSTVDRKTWLHLATPQATQTQDSDAIVWQLDGVGTFQFDGRYRYADLDSDGLLDAYRLDELAPIRTGLKAVSGYRLLVRYLVVDTDADVSSNRYYTYTAEQAHPIDFVTQALDTTTPLRWRSLSMADTALADVDGDGRADLVLWGIDNEETFPDQGGSVVLSSLERLTVFRQSGTGSARRFVPYGPAVDVNPASPAAPRAVQVRDLNQDGLSDLVYFTGKRYNRNVSNPRWTGDWHYRLSTGTGYTGATVLLDTPANAEAPRAPSLHDDNGDGYPDFLWHDVKAKQLKRKRYEPATGTFGAEAKVHDTKGEDEERYLTVDMNGDGHGDLLYFYHKKKTKTLTQYYQPTPGRPHLITTVTNGLGAKTQLTYESLSRTEAYVRIHGVHTTKTEDEYCINPRGEEYCYTLTRAVLNAADFYTALNTPWADRSLTHALTAATGAAPVLELMGPLYVVTQVQSSAPTATNANATSGIGYIYEQGKLQAAGRGLLGFKALTTLDLQTGVSTTTTYRQDFPYIGYPQTTEVRTKTGKLLRKAINTWQLQGYQDDDPTTPDVDESWNALVAERGIAVLGALQPYLANAVETTYDLPATKTENNVATTEQGARLTTVTTENTYDNRGNPTRITTTTEDHANGKHFRQITDNTYDGATDAQRLGRLIESTVTRERDFNGDKDFDDDDESQARTAAFSYYPAGSTWEHLLESETRHPRNYALAHKTTYHYDAFGNRIRATVTAIGGKDGRTKETRCGKDTVRYDSAGRYPVMERDCEGRPRRAMSRHNGWGQPTTVKQFIDTDNDAVETNNPARATTHTHTAGGWLAVSRESTGAHSGQYRAQCASSDTYCPTGAAYYIGTRQAGGAEQWDYRDKLDRTIRTRTAGFDKDTWVLTDTEYDNLGRIARQSEPYYAGKPAYWTTYTYDLLGRVIKTTLPDYETDSNDAVIRNSVITTAYTGLTTTTTNGEGQRHTETRNALGEVIRATDNAGTPVTHSYDAWGQVIETATGAGDDPVRVQWTYDARGRRTAVKDPDWTPKTNTARYTYTWNGFDELITQTDRIGNEQVMTYDGLGRLLTRTDYAPDGSDSDYDPDLTGAATWTYDGAMNGLGQVQTVTDTVSGYTRKQDYDTHGRESVTTLTIETGQYGGRQKTYATRQTYDEYGRPYQVFDARLETTRPADQFTDNVTQVHYNARGYACQWTDGVQVNDKPRRTYREITALDARGQVTGETLGGGVVRTRRTHEAKTGRITGVTHRNALLREVQADSYGWDVLGNLDSRTSRRGNNTLAETFTYDSLNRLTEAKGTHTYHNPDTRTDTTQDLAAQTVTYNALGNITHKSDVGEYAYDSNQPYAVSQTKDNNKTIAAYSYDAMGNQTSGDGRILEYTPFHKVKAIFRGSPAEVYFTYGPDRARITRTDVTRDSNGRSTTTTVYLGNVEHVIAQNGSSTYKRYLANGSVLITQDHDRFDTRTAEDTRYLVKDHLGSLTTILDRHGSLIQSLSYDAWGQRRNPTTAAMLELLTLRSTLHSRTTPRGYTGHEMLDAVGIIHMNGRIYDPKLGRFLQADPVVQFPHYSQGQNTYSYVLNNPLVYTDPTGYFPIFTALAVVGLIAAEVTTTVIIAAVIGTAVFADSLAQGVPLDKAFLAGVSAAALTAVSLGTFPKPVHGGFGWNLATAQHVATVAVTGGITASLQGGKFGHGFLSAGIGAGVGGIPGLRGLQSGKIAARTVVSAVTAGTVSEITGGKFANGAMTAAFFSLISSAAQRASRPNFDDMSNQELADWIQKNGAEFGIETPDGLKVVAIDEYRQFDEVLGWVECSDALCEGRIDTVIYGHYDKRRNQIELFKPAFEAGEHSFALSQSDVRGAVLSREAIAVQSFGHEAAHSMGIDMIRNMAPTHYNAERIGLDAMRRFRNKYE